MKLRSCLPLVLATFALCAAPAWSVDYNLKKSSLKTGDTLSVESVMTMTDGTLSMSIQTQNIKGSMNMDKRKVQLTKITGAGADGVTGVEVEIKADTEKQAIVIAGQTQGGDKQEPLHGTTVVAQREGGKWTSKLKTGEPTPPQAKALEKLRFFESDEFYEDRPVAVGQSWNVPPERIAKAMGESVGGDFKGAMQCKFERVETLNGQPCAVIAVEMKLSGKVPDQPEAILTMEMKGTIHRTLDQKFDAKLDLTGTMKMEGPIPNPPGAKMEASGPMKITETTTLVK